MRKMTIEEVEPQFKQRGWQLLSTTYEGSQKPLLAICSEGHETTITWNNFQRGQGCRICAGNEKFTLDQVQMMFTEANCELLTTNYKDNQQKLDYRCLCGNVSSIRLGEFRRGHRCQTCKAKANSETFRTPDEELANFCKEQGCQFVKSWIQKRKTRLTYICKCGQSTDAYWFNFKRFPNCKKCGAAKISGANCHMYDPDREAVAMRKRFRKMCGQHIKRFMEATGQKKTRHTHELLGYHPRDLQEHILSHLDYKFCIGKEWHVDHIFPIQAFLDHGILDLKIINHLSNLRPMLGPDNLVKADKYDEKEFKEWCMKFEKRP